MQGQAVLAEPLRQDRQEPLGILLAGEQHHEVVREPEHLRVAHEGRQDVPDEPLVEHVGGVHHRAHGEYPAHLDGWVHQAQMPALVPQRAAVVEEQLERGPVQEVEVGEVHDDDRHPPPVALTELVRERRERGTIELAVQRDARAAPLIDAEDAEGAARGGHWLPSEPPAPLTVLPCAKPSLRSGCGPCPGAWARLRAPR